MAEPLFPDGLVGESFGDQFGLVVDIAPVDHQRIGHALSNHRPRRETELFPFGQQHPVSYTHLDVYKRQLFNRLVGQRQAIVDSTAGTTRDRHYGKTDWNGKEFSVIDTGGYTVNSDDIFEDAIRRQVMLAIDEADVILFLVEVSTGITDLDPLMADILRRTTKKVILLSLIHI